MTRLPRLLLTTAAIAILLAACGTVDEPTDPADAPEEPGDEDVVPDDGDDQPDDGTDPDANGDDPVSGTYGEQIETAVADAAAHFDVEPGDIEVVTAEAVTWPDGAIGCPEPDMMYTQALVDGYRIVLAVDGDEVAYHGEDGGEPRRCDDPTDPVE